MARDVIRYGIQVDFKYFGTPVTQLYPLDIDPSNPPLSTGINKRSVVTSSSSLTNTYNWEYKYFWDFDDVLIYESEYRNGGVLGTFWKSSSLDTPSAALDRITVDPIPLDIAGDYIASGWLYNGNWTNLGGSAISNRSTSIYSYKIATAYDFAIGVSIPKVDGVEVAFFNSVETDSDVTQTEEDSANSKTTFCLWTKIDENTTQLRVSVKTPTTRPSSLVDEDSDWGYFLKSVYLNGVDITNIVSRTRRSVSSHDSVYYYVYEINTTISEDANISTPEINPHSLVFNFEKKKTVTINVNVYKYDGIEIMSLDESDDSNTVDMGDYIQTTIVREVKEFGGEQCFNLSLKDNIANGDDIYYLYNPPTGVLGANWNYSFTRTISSLLETINVSFGKYRNVSVEKAEGVNTALIETRNVIENDFAFKPAVLSGETIRVPNGEYKISATTSEPYFFTPSNAIGTYRPLTAQTSYATQWLAIGGNSDLNYVISAQKLSLTLQFPESLNDKYSQLGVLSIDGGNTSTDLETKTYTFGFTPTQDNLDTYAWSIDYILLSDNTRLNYAGGLDGTTQTIQHTVLSITNDLTATVVLKQTKQKLTITNGSGGNSSSEIRSLSDNSIIASKSGTEFYVNPTTEYVVFIPSPANNYKFSHFSNIDGLQAYDDGNSSTHAFSFIAQFDAEITINFTRRNYFIEAESTLPSTCSTYIQATTENGQINQQSGYYSKDDYGAASNPIYIHCALNTEYDGQYKVSQFNIYDYHTGALFATIPEAEIEKSLEGRDEYWCGWYPVSGAYNDYRIEAVLTSLYYDVNLVVKHGYFQVVDGDEVWVDGGSTFGWTTTSVGVETQTYDNNFEQSIRNGTPLTISCGTYYGGKLERIVIEDIEGVHTHTNNPFSYTTLLGNATITVYFVEQPTYTVKINSLVWNDATIKCGTVKIESSRYPLEFAQQSNDNGSISSFTVYKNEEYTLSYNLDGSQDKFAREYFFQGWGRVNDLDFTSDFDIGGLVPNESFSVFVPEEDISNVRIGAFFGKRETKPIHLSYAIRSLDNDGVEIITPITEEELKAEFPESSFVLSDSQFYDEATGEYFTGNDVSITCTIRGDFATFIEEGFNTPTTTTLRPVYIRRSVHTDNQYSIIASQDKLMVFSSTFKMIGETFLQAVFERKIERGKLLMTLAYRGQADKRMGNLSVFSTKIGDNYIEDNGGCRALVQGGERAVIMASVRPHYSFAGWFKLNDEAYELVSEYPVYEIDGNDINVGIETYYAYYLPSSFSRLLQWDGDKENKRFIWRSKVYVASSYFGMNSIAIYADSYPVTVTCFASSSPTDIWNSVRNKVQFQIMSQTATRVPYLKPEKYFGFQVEGNARINHVAIASSMGALL